MGMNNYFDFAEDDYKYFVDSYNSGLVANSMGANAQNICEKYLKHLISEYDTPEEEQGFKSKETVLRTHSIHRLLKYIQNNLNMEFSTETKNSMKMIDGFYFTCRYPGDDSIEIDKESLKDCLSAITGCREEVIAFIKQNKQKEKEQMTGIEDPVKQCMKMTAEQSLKKNNVCEEER